MPEVRSDEILSRFLFDRSEIRENGALHWKALMPNPEGETSVFRISGCSEGEILVMGFGVAALRNKVLIGRGDITAQSVLSSSLQVRADSDPGSKHADILGWPIEKDAKKAIAMALAEVASAKRL